MITRVLESRLMRTWEIRLSRIFKPGLKIREVGKSDGEVRDASLKQDKTILESHTIMYNFLNILCNIYLPRS